MYKYRAIVQLYAMWLVAWLGGGLKIGLKSMQNSVFLAVLRLIFALKT